MTRKHSRNKTSYDSVLGRATVSHTPRELSKLDENVAKCLGKMAEERVVAKIKNARKSGRNPWKLGSKRGGFKSRIWTKKVEDHPLPANRIGVFSRGGRRFMLREPKKEGGEVSFDVGPLSDEKRLWRRMWERRRSNRQWNGPSEGLGWRTHRQDNAAIV